MTVIRMKTFTETKDAKAKQKQQKSNEKSFSFFSIIACCPITDGSANGMPIGNAEAESMWLIYAAMDERNETINEAERTERENRSAQTHTQATKMG